MKCKKIQGSYFHFSNKAVKLSIITLDEIQQQIKINPYHPLPYIKLASYYLEQGEDDKARKIILTRRRMSHQDASYHAQWAALCENVGVARQAIESWEMALAQDSKNGEYLYRLGILYYETGKIEKAMRMLQKSLKCSPSHAGAKKILADIYEELGDVGSARSLREEKNKSKNSQHQELTILPQVTIDDAALILTLFKGKEVGYALQTFDQAGRSVFSYVEEPLSPNRIIDHLFSKLTIGVYPLRKDKALKFTALHVRINPRKMMENFKNTSYLVLMEGKVHEYLSKLAATCHNLNIPSYLEDGGEHDRRLWFFLDEFLPYQLMKRFVDSILDKMPPAPSDVQVEICLGLKTLGVGWEHYPLLLPLGINQRTGRRCLFIDYHGSPYDDQLAYVKKIRTIKTREMRDLLQTVSREVRGMETIIPAKPGHVEALRLKCLVLAEIINKARAGRNLSRQEKLILYYTLGLFDDKGKSIHYVLEPTPEYRPQKVDKLISQLKSNPVSCPKIRELLPETTAYVRCDCDFLIPEGGYPSPLIHVNPGLVEGKRDALLASPHSLQEAARRYISLLSEIEQLKKSLLKLENVIIPLFDKKKVNQISTPFGCVKKVTNGDGVKLAVRH
jgi:tetratricopeptide (TPR) repeat protein